MAKTGGQGIQVGRKALGTWEGAELYNHGGKIGRPIRRERVIGNWKGKLGQGKGREPKLGKLQKRKDNEIRKQTEGGGGRQGPWEGVRTMGKVVNREKSGWSGRGGVKTEREEGED